MKDSGAACVHMTVDDLEVDEAILARAKSLLVRTARVGLAENDYDAQSNGNFDEMAVTTAADDNGAIFIFECRDGEGEPATATGQDGGFG